MRCNFIVYVRDQEASANFYRFVLGQEPSLHVPGMTEFQVRDGCVIGLMPEKGIKRLLGDSIEDPETNQGASRAEIYLTVQHPELFLARALKSGARLLSPLSLRDWGDEAGYVLDLDGTVLAFARSSAS